MRKNNSKNKDDYALIKEYYDKALTALKSDEPAQGGKIIYSMPVKLYDMSLDILDNKNDEFSDQELRELIETVDTLITKLNSNGVDEDSDITDVFLNGTF